MGALEQPALLGFQSHHLLGGLVGLEGGLNTAPLPPQPYEKS